MFSTGFFIFWGVMCALVWWAVEKLFGHLDP